MKNSHIKIKCKNKIYFAVAAFAVLLMLFFLTLASAADPGHGSAVIGSGTFESGNYVFPNNLAEVKNE